MKRIIASVLNPCLVIPALAAGLDVDTEKFGFDDQFQLGAASLQVRSHNLKRQSPATDIPADWGYSGCYEDSDASNPLLVGQIGPTGPTYNAGCISYCSTAPNNFTVAGTTDGDSCLCAYSINNEARKRNEPANVNPPPYCNSPCTETGRSTEACGGATYVSVYRQLVVPADSDLPTGWRYDGCYTDSNAERTLRSYIAQGKYELSGSNPTDAGTSNSAFSCITTCDGQGYAYAGTQGTMCYCAGVIQRPGAIDPAGGCNTPCGGAPFEPCGGGTTHISVYTLRAPGQGFPYASAPATLAQGWTYKGCYMEVALTVEQSHQDDDLDTATCLATCKGENRKYAATTDGSTCVCGDTLVDDATTKFPPTVAPAEPQCVAPCAGAETEACGGLQRLSVYEDANYVSRGGNNAQAPAPFVSGPQVRIF